MSRDADLPAPLPATPAAHGGSLLSPHIVAEPRQLLLAVRALATAFCGQGPRGSSVDFW